MVRLETAIPTTIFELPQVKSQVDMLFEKMKDDIKARFEEIKCFIISNSKTDNIYSKITYDEIADLFKIYFYKSVLNDVVEITFMENGKYNVVENILELLSEEKLKNAILGKTMIKAFEKAIRNLPADGGLTTCIHGGTIFLLEKNFLGE